MKTFYIVFALLMTINSFSQNPMPGSIENICSDLTAEDVPNYTYFSDLNNTFGNFVGIWKWINGNEIVTFQLSKVTHKYFPENKIYKDYMVGNYSYTIDGGNSFIVNTITSPIDENPSENPMYTPCVENNKLKFIFKDVVLDKSYCYATFEFLSGNLNQMHLSIKNPEGSIGRFEGEPIYNHNFTLPTDMVVTKQ